MRANSSGIRLNKSDAAIAKAMITRGDRQHDIASWFGVNGGRIAEISTGDKFAGVSTSTDKLPPKGPYGPPLRNAMNALNEARKVLEKAQFGHVEQSEVTEALKTIDKFSASLRY